MDKLSILLEASREVKLTDSQEVLHTLQEVAKGIVINGNAPKSPNSPGPRSSQEVEEPPGSPERSPGTKVTYFLSSSF